MFKNLPKVLLPLSMTFLSWPRRIPSPLSISVGGGNVHLAYHDQMEKDVNKYITGYNEAVTAEAKEDE